MRIKLGIVLLSIATSLQAMDLQENPLVESLKNRFSFATGGFEQQLPIRLCYVENQNEKYSATVKAIQSFKTSEGKIQSLSQLTKGMDTQNYISLYYAADNKIEKKLFDFNSRQEITSFIPKGFCQFVVYNYSSDDGVPLDDHVQKIREIYGRNHSLRFVLSLDRRKDTDMLERMLKLRYIKEIPQHHKKNEPNEDELWQEMDKLPTVPESERSKFDLKSFLTWKTGAIAGGFIIALLFYYKIIEIKINVS